MAEGQNTSRTKRVAEIRPPKKKQIWAGSTILVIVMVNPRICGSSKPGATRGTSQGAKIAASTVTSTSPTPIVEAVVEKSFQAPSSSPRVAKAEKRGMKVMDKVPPARK